MGTVLKLFVLEERLVQLSVLAPWLVVRLDVFFVRLAKMVLSET